MKHILLNGARLIDIKKSGKHNTYYLDNGEQIKTKDIIDVLTECPKCLRRRKLKKLHYINLERPSCIVCSNSGTNNHFYGKRHSDISKEKMSVNSIGKNSGSLNPMYGKSIYDYWREKYNAEEVERKIIQHKNKVSKATSGINNPMHGKRISEEAERKRVDSLRKTIRNRSEAEKERISKIYSDMQKKNIAKDPAKYREQRRKAGRVSLSKQKKYKINKIEKKLQDKLKEMGLYFEYSVILNHKQFDFGNKEKRILIEVQGDYWHANPNKYTKDQYTEVQRQNIKRDKEKIEFAKKHNMYLYHIWEDAIIKQDFSVLEQIKKDHFNEN